MNPVDNYLLGKAYQELIMAVEKKYPGESRHATALRYIREAERHESGPPKEEQP